MIPPSRGIFRPGSRPIAAQDQAVLLQTVVAVEAFVARRRRRTLGLTVTRQTLQAPYAGRTEAFQVSHHDVRLPSRTFDDHAVLLFHPEPIEHDDGTV